MKTVLKKVGVVLVLITLVTLIVGKFAFPLVVNRFITMEASYVEYPVETMIMEADIIFLGQVAAVSETRWNQENGQYWNDGLPYHEVTLSVIRPIAGELEDEVRLTIIGNNPLDKEFVLESNHALKANDEIVIFARDTEFTWREPKRIPAIMFMGSPNTSILAKGEDGLYYSVNGDSYSLDDLINEVKQ
ncbi:hypothetical protein MNBD_CHLOROFLEXI01-4461 [hydrothermal vent metagenome]|uniref:Uncharacterized protein n=1 Tax=hydrothermal vent metagenome TaxID=652676 RepID=A0A3B0VHF8_9ZZZZ